LELEGKTNRNILRFLSGDWFLKFLSKSGEPDQNIGVYKFEKEKYLVDKDEKDKKKQQWFVPKYTFVEFEFDDPKEIYVDTENHNIYVKITTHLTKTNLDERFIEENNFILTDQYDAMDMLESVTKCIEHRCHGGVMDTSWDYSQKYGDPCVFMDHITFKILDNQKGPVGPSPAGPENHLENPIAKLVHKISYKFT